MKKTMAAILAMLMVLSAVPFAFAEEVTNTTDDSVVEPDTGDDSVPVDDSVDDTSTDEGVDDSSDDGADLSEDSDEVEAEDETETEIEIEIENESESNETEEEDEIEIELEDENETEEEDEEEDVVEIPENVTEEAGVTPGSALWGLERAIERISLKLTWGKSAKAKKGLAHARERLMEVQAMIAAKRFGEAAEAQEAYDEIMEDVEENVEGLGNGDALGELEDETEIEQALAENEAVVQATSQLRAKVKAKGITAEQESQLNSIVGSLSSATGKLDVKVQEKKDRTKIKIKAQAGLSDEEVNAVAAQVQQAVASGKKFEVKIKNKERKAESAEDESDDEGDDSEEDESLVGASSNGMPEKEDKSKGNGKKK